VSTPLTCIVLAGGLGTRLRSVLADVPKCLAPVGARSFLEIQLEFLAGQGVERFVLSLGHLAQQVEAASKSFRLAERLSIVTEPHALGTGGAVLHAMASTCLD
jgi:D-glycero-alpha-D-manno-heptose 1-phosphate guanylyltransferase